MPSQLLNTQQAAGYLNLSKSTLEAWRSKGLGPVFLRAGHNVRYRQEDLDRWLADNTERPGVS